LRYFGSPNQTKQSDKQCQGNAEADTGADSGRVLSEQRQPEESDSILSDEVFFDPQMIGRGSIPSS
jgi:hypothetical protein